MFKGSKYPEEAKTLLKHFASQEGIQSTSTFFVPPRQSVLSSEEFINQPNNPSEGTYRQAVIEEMTKARIIPWTRQLAKHRQRDSARL